MKDFYKMQCYGIYIPYREDIDHLLIIEKHWESITQGIVSSECPYNRFGLTEGRYEIMGLDYPMNELYEFGIASLPVDAKPIIKYFRLSPMEIYNIEDAEDCLMRVKADIANKPLTDI